MNAWCRLLAPGVAAALAHAVLSIAAEGLYPINTLPSIPIGLYRMVQGARPGRGDIVLVCLPRNVAVLARARGYLTQGRCPADIEPLGKQVAAGPSDTVQVTATGLVVNGRPVASTAPLRVDSRGRSLPQLTGVQWVLEPGQLWLVGTHNVRSFDSRYFGPVSTHDVIAVLRPVWTW